MNQQAKETLRKALKRIQENPESWNQKKWHCGTSHCIAGHIDMLIGVPKEFESNLYNHLHNNVQEFLGLSARNYNFLTRGDNSLEYLEYAVTTLCTNKSTTLQSNIRKLI